MLRCLLWIAATCCLAAAETAPILRVMSWNLHHGEGVDGKIDLERIARRITAEKPDLVVLQEVDDRTKRCGAVDQTAELARLTGLHGAFGKAMDFQGGGYGQAVLSRFPIAETQVHRLPGGGEPRIAFEARVKVAGRAVSLVGLHLDHQQEARRVGQAKAVIEAFAKPGSVAIVAGDFNDGAESATLTAFAGDWKRVAKREPVATHPAEKPDVEIDHVVVRGLEAVEPAWVVDEAAASDHRPVMAVLRLPEAKP